MDLARREFIKAAGAGSILMGTAAAGAWGATVTVVPGKNDRAAIQEAIAAVEQNGGGTVSLAAGEYLLDGEIVISQNGVRLVGESRATVLKAAAGEQTLIHFAASHGGVENLTLDGSPGDQLEGMIWGTAGPVEPRGVTAIKIEPRLPVPPDRRVHQNYNRFSNLLIAGCREGITLRAGPTVPQRGDSGCWYNVFDTILIIYTTRGLWLRDPINNIGSSVNRNQFYSVRIGQSVNTGVQIDAGDTNSFFGCSFEGVGYGNSPSETPTAMVIKQAASTGAHNNHNTFICTRFEGNVVDLENHNAYTELFASNVAYGRGRFRGSNPLYVVGGSDPSDTPLVMPGMVYPEGSLPDVPSQINFTRAVRFHRGFTNDDSAQ